MGVNYKLFDKLSGRQEPRRSRRGGAGTTSAGRPTGASKTVKLELPHGATAGAGWGLELETEVPIVGPYRGRQSSMQPPQRHGSAPDRVPRGPAETASRWGRW